MGTFILAIDQGTTSIARHRVRRASEHHRPRPAGVPAALPALRLGRARPRRSLAHGAGDLAHAPWTKPAFRRAISPASASPTSARRRWSGTARPASRSTTPSSGRTGAPRTSAHAEGRRATRRSSPPRPACCSTPISPAPRSPGSSTHVAGALRARGEGRARLRHRRQLPDLAPDRRQVACDRRHQRLAHAAARHPQRRTGTMTCCR